MNNLINKSKEELISLIKTEELLSELESNFINTTEILISNKLCPDLLIKSLNQSNINNFITICLEQDFCPDFKIIESFTETLSENTLIQLFSKFTSLPVTIQYITQIINLKLEDLSVLLVEKNKQFQKDEIILLIVSQNFKNDKIADFLINCEVACQFIFNNLDYNFNALFINTAFLSFKPNNKFSYISNKQILPILNKNNLISFLEELSKVKQPSYYYNKEDNAIEYFAGLESIADDIPFNININNAPINSKFRTKSLYYNPQNATNEELIELSPSKKIITEILSRDLEFIKTVDIDVFKKLTPAQLRDAIETNDTREDVAIYFYENLTSNYGSQLSKLIDANKIIKNSRKKSFFKEALYELRKENIENFRQVLSDKYTLENFIEDSFQKTKIAELENIYLDETFILKLTKKELFSLYKTKVSFKYIEDTTNIFNFTLEEALHLLDKLNTDFIFHNISNTEDKQSFIKNLNSHYIETLLNSLKQPIIDEFIDLILTQALETNTKLSISDEMLDIILKNSERKNIVLFLQINEYDFYSYLNLKDKNNEYVISEEMIKNFLVNYKKVIDSSFIKNLMLRDFNLTKQLIKAYSEGSKSYSELIGKPIKITRDKKILEKLNNLLELCGDDYQSKIKKMEESEQIDLSEAKKVLPDSEYMNICKNKKTLIDKHNLSNTTDYELTTLLNLASEITINNLYIDSGYNDYYLEFLEVLSSPKIILNNAIITNSLTENSIKILKQLEQSKNIQITLEDNGDNLSVDTKFLLTINGYNLFNRQKVLNDYFNKNLNNLSFSEFILLDNEGIIIYNKETIQKIITNHKDNLEILEFISKKYTNFNDFFINDFYAKYLEKENLELIKKLNIQILSDHQIKILEIKDAIQKEGENFSPININSFSTTEKLEIIKFIEDLFPDYKKLNLKSSNITELSSLYPYEAMKEDFIIDESSIIEKFKVPANLQNNKKLLKNIKDFLTLKGFSFNSLFMNYKKGLELLNQNFSFEFKEIFNYSDIENLSAHHNLNIFNYRILKVLEEKLAIISNEEILTKNKQEWLQLIKSSNEMGSNYLNDIFDMTLNINEGLLKLKERLSTEEEQEPTEELEVSIKGLEQNLSKILKMNEATHIHDRLETLADFIKSNPSEKLNQNKFKKLEEDKKHAKELGYQLYFPKTRGELQYLGDENDWCVNKSRHYGDNVIKHGNILVGIVPLDKENTKENVIVLAHFTKNKSNKYILEQIRWSSKIKNERNVDASNDFNTNQIISLISSFLKQKG